MKIKIKFRVLVTIVAVLFSFFAGIIKNSRPRNHRSIKIKILRSIIKISLQELQMDILIL